MSIGYSYACTTYWLLGRSYPPPVPALNAEFPMSPIPSSRLIFQMPLWPKAFFRPSSIILLRSQEQQPVVSEPSTLPSFFFEPWKTSPCSANRFWFLALIPRLCLLILTTCLLTVAGDSQILRFVSRYSSSSLLQLPQLRLFWALI